MTGKWWELVQIGHVPAVIVVNFVSERCVDAFSVFHFSGMLGTLESHAEIICGTLKRLAKSLSTRRAVESTILRSVGFSGCGGGGEDGFFGVVVG